MWNVLFNSNGKRTANSGRFIIAIKVLRGARLKFLEEINISERAFDFMYISSEGGSIFLLQSFSNDFSI